MTSLIGRSAAYLGAGRWDPVRLGSAIAPFDIVISATMPDWCSAQCQRRHVRRWRDEALAVREVVTADSVTETIIGHGSSHGELFIVVED